VVLAERRQPHGFFLHIAVAALEALPDRWNKNMELWWEISDMARQFFFFFAS